MQIYTDAYTYVRTYTSYIISPIYQVRSTRSISHGLRVTCKADRRSSHPAVYHLFSFLAAAASASAAAIICRPVRWHIYDLKGHHLLLLGLGFSDSLGSALQIILYFAQSTIFPNRVFLHFSIDYVSPRFIFIYTNYEVYALVLCAVLLPVVLL